MYIYYIFGLFSKVIFTKNVFEFITQDAKTVGFLQLLSQKCFQACIKSAWRRLNLGNASRGF